MVRCSTCKYRGEFQASRKIVYCDFLCKTGHMRKCPPDDCIFYKKGKKYRNRETFRVIPGEEEIRKAHEVNKKEEEGK